jgi:DNA gyrase subunit B
MAPEDLAETTMAPDKRIMRQVSLDEAEEADRIVSILMGDNVISRRNYIVEHAKEVENLDLWA